MILRHQAWIYNTALQMVWHPQDAEDVTQEILIKVITRLSSFQGKSSFRTWLYRIVANHVINMRKRPFEKRYISFERFGKGIDGSPDSDLPDQENFPIDMNLIIEDIKFGCMTAMLLCLNRQQRLIFIIGALWGVSDRIGSEIVGISKVNFRKKLSRARKQVANFMQDRCGLIKNENSCHCANKVEDLIKIGHVNPDDLHFSTKYVAKIRALVPARFQQLQDFYESKCHDLFQNMPFKKSPDFVKFMRETLQRPEFQEIFELRN